MKRVYRGARSPSTPEEWQEAVDGASFFLAIDSVRQYGLIEGGPGVNVERCRLILERGRARGYRPRPFDELLEVYLPELLAPTPPL